METIDLSTEQPAIVPASPADLDQLLPLVRAYHAFEHVQMTDPARRGAVVPLLEAGNTLGRIWLIHDRNRLVGYIAVCFGYSIEFAGRDAFVDELFIEEASRGHGIGTAVLTLVQAEVAALGIAALHLEVDRGNERARRLYGRAGFEAREQFHLMSWRKPPALP